MHHRCILPSRLYWWSIHHNPANSIQNINSVVSTVLVVILLEFYWLFHRMGIAMTINAKEIGLWSVVHYRIALQWRHNGRDSVPNHQPRDCLFSRLIRQRSKKTSKLRVSSISILPTLWLVWEAFLPSRQRCTILHYCDDIMSAMASQITIQPFIQALIKENIKDPRHWPLCGEFTGDRWIPLHKGQVTRKLLPFDDVIMNRSKLLGRIGDKPSPKPMISS